MVSLQSVLGGLLFGVDSLSDYPSRGDDCWPCPSPCSVKLWYPGIIYTVSLIHSVKYCCSHMFVHEVFQERKWQHGTRAANNCACLLDSSSEVHSVPVLSIAMREMPMMSVLVLNIYAGHDFFLRFHVLRFKCALCLRIVLDGPFLFALLMPHGISRIIYAGTLVGVGDKCKEEKMINVVLHLPVGTCNNTPTLINGGLK